jgi:hypothetical protein
MRPPAGGRQYIYWHQSLRPPLRPYLGNVAKLIRRRRISLKRDHSHPKNPSVKSMAPPAPRAAHCIANSSQRIATSSQRIGLRIPCITAHRANATSPRAAHRIANNPRTVQRAARTDNQPAAHRPQRTAHTSHLQHCTRFAVLCARLFGSWY